MTNDFDPKTIRKQLDAKRREHGAESKIGRRCSNLIEQLKSHQLYIGHGYLRRELEKNITKSVADLAKLTTRHKE